MFIDLYSILVEQVIGGFILTVLVLAAVIFLIMGVMGKMSGTSVIYYILLFFMAMLTGWGYRMFAILIAFVLLIWLYLEIKSTTSG